MNYKDSAYYTFLLALTGLRHSPLLKDQKNKQLVFAQMQEAEPVLEKLLDDVVTKNYVAGEFMNQRIYQLKSNIKKQATSEAESYWNGIRDKAKEFERLTGYSYQHGL
jgi:hypothetical protein